MSKPPKANMLDSTRCDKQTQEPERLIQLAPSLLSAIHHIPGAFPCPELDLLLAQHSNTPEHSSASMDAIKEQHATHATPKPSEEIQKTLPEDLDHVKQQFSQALQENSWLRKQKAHDDAKRDGIDLFNEDEDDSDEDDCDEDDDWDADEPLFGSIEMALYVAGGPREQERKTPVSCMSRKDLEREHDALILRLSVAKEEHHQTLAKHEEKENHRRHQNLMNIRQINHLENECHLNEKYRNRYYAIADAPGKINELRRELVEAKKEHLETVAKLETQLSDKNVYISTCDKKIEGLQGKVAQLVRRDRTTELMCNQSISQTYSELQLALEKLERGFLREAELKKDIDAKSAEVLRLTTQVEELASRAIDDHYTIQQYQAVISTTPSVPDQKSGVEDTVVEPLTDLSDDGSGRSSTGSQCGSDWTDVSIHHGGPDVGGN